MKQRLPALDGQPPDFKLRYGVAVQLLSEMGFQGGVSPQTFREYIKSLRKLDLPFGRGESRNGVRLACYRYNHVMELALVLSLRIYNAVPDVVIEAIRDHRPLLYELYDEAWRRRVLGGRDLLTLSGRDGSLKLRRGAYLDLKIVHDGRRLISFGPPQLIDAVEAARLFAAAPETGQAVMPVRLSALAERLAQCWTAMSAQGFKPAHEASDPLELTAEPSRLFAAARRH